MKSIRNIRAVCILLLLIFAFSGLWEAILSLSPRYLYRKDLLQFYLQAKALWVGIDPYQPLPQLAGDLQFPPPAGIFQHPAPHPPFLAILCLPLTFVEYEIAAGTWVVSQYLALFASIEILMQWWRGRSSLWWSAFFTLALFRIGPFWEDVIWGQVNIFQLFLFVYALHLMRTGRQPAGGIALGVAIAIKYIGWPLLLLLGFRRQWIALTYAAMTLAITNLVGFSLIGRDGTIKYFFQIGPQVHFLYRASIYNWSIWSLGWRLFSGTGAPALIDVRAEPMIAAPSIATTVSLLLAGMTLFAGLRLALRTNQFEAAYGLLLAISILISPLMWPHYLTMMAIPLFWGTWNIRSLRFPRTLLLESAILGIALFLPRQTTENVMRLLATSSAPDGEIVVPFAATLIGLIPMLVIIVTIYWSYRISILADQAKSPSAENFHSSAG